MTDPEDINPAKPNLKDNADGLRVVTTWFAWFAIAVVVVITMLLWKSVRGM